MKRILTALACTALLASCRTEVVPVVRTLNPGYDRATSRALVREVLVPTRANLDYAAWNANMILLDTATVDVHPAKVVPESLLAGGLLADVKTSVEATPLSDSEIASPMAWKPVEDLWLAWSFDSAGPLATKVQEFAQKRWGDTTGTWIPFQQIVALHLHATPAGDEIWVRVEFPRWMASHLGGGIQDRDGDGFPEAWARLAAPELKPPMVAMLRGDYTRKALTRAEAVQWANELAALWYPVHNTDMIDLATENVFPQSSTESEVVKELGDLRVGEPLAVMRGRPFGTPLYLVFVVPSQGGKDSTAKASVADVERSIDSTAGLRLVSISGSIAGELALHGDWVKWSGETEPFRRKAAHLEASVPATTQGLVGPGGTLLFRRELSYVQADDLARLAPSENPVARIKALRDSLAGLGVDFLFVPVPTKLDVDPSLLGGGKTDVVQPWSRKLLLDLAEAGVETVDLLPALRGKGLWRKQDTHWKPQGAEAAAALVAERIRAYGWYAAAARDSLILARKDTIWTDFGDLRDRLEPAAKAKIAQESVTGARFFGPDGKPWDDSEKSPILLLGDSYLGVYQKIAPRAAGFSSLLAADLKLPVTLAMGWGGGPEAPRKLAGRGPDGLRGKRLVVWIMSQRDLFRYPGGWSAK